MTAFPILNLQKWIRENRANLKPPVSNKQLFTGSADCILFVSGGPNTRNDFHVNPTEELFYQLKGDIAVRVRPLDGGKPKDIIVKEGELFLLPRWVPHRPQRPAGTVGMVVEFPRPNVEGREGMDGLQWYCPECDTLVHDHRWRLKKIDEDLAVIMHAFWNGPAEQRTCRNCGHVIQQAGAIQLTKGRVTSAAKPRRAASASKDSKARKTPPLRKASTRRARPARR